jgi:hypothetical protein
MGCILCMRGKCYTGVIGLAEGEGTLTVYRQAKACYQPITCRGVDRRGPTPSQGVAERGGGCPAGADR